MRFVNCILKNQDEIFSITMDKFRGTDEQMLALTGNDANDAIVLSEKELRYFI